MKYISILISNVQQYKARVKIAVQLAKIAMSTPAYAKRTLTLKLLQAQRNKDCPVAHTALDNYDLDMSAESIHVSFNTQNKTMTTVRKMR